MQTPTSVVDAIVELNKLGQLLDAADNKQFPLSPRNYRQAAVRVKSLIRAHFDSNQVHEVCLDNRTLAEIRSGLVFEAEVALGRAAFLIDLSRFRDRHD